VKGGSLVGLVWRGWEKLQYEREKRYERRGKQYERREKHYEGKKIAWEILVRRSGFVVFVVWVLELEQRGVVGQVVSSLVGPIGLVGSSHVVLRSTIEETVAFVGLVAVALAVVLVVLVWVVGFVVWVVPVERVVQQVVRLAMVAGSAGGVVVVAGVVG